MCSTKIIKIVFKGVETVPNHSAIVMLSKGSWLGLETPPLCIPSCINVSETDCEKIVSSVGSLKKGRDDPNNLSTVEVQQATLWTVCRGSQARRRSLRAANWALISFDNLRATDSVHIYDRLSCGEQQPWALIERRVHHMKGASRWSC